MTLRKHSWERYFLTILNKIESDKSASLSDAALFVESVFYYKLKDKFELNAGRVKAVSPMPLSARSVSKF